ncbi:MAG: S58 family peptidase [Bdellovibrionales bacterium]|nr:S58 family peptidase [Bdellovibrionales bacterium]
MKHLFIFFVFSFFTGHCFSRVRDLGVPLPGTPGKLNSLADIQGVEVGHVTLISGAGPLIIGKGPIRTGATAIFPKGKVNSPVPAAWFSLNGNGELTGTTWMEETGFLDGPIILTNTNSVGVARDAVQSWANLHLTPKESTLSDDPASLPVVGETWDGRLNDLRGNHVTKEKVFEALNNAKPGPFAEGNVGGGTGMVSFAYKSGIGTSSRQIQIGKEKYLLGALVQSNFGTRDELQINGKNIAKIFKDPIPKLNLSSQKDGSIIVVIGTDAPLLSHQLKRVAKRVSLGIGKVGGISHDSSGDIFIAFSSKEPKKKKQILVYESIPNEEMDEIFRATIEATEEAILNALVAATGMTGINENRVEAISHEKLRTLFQNP